MKPHTPFFFTLALGLATNPVLRAEELPAAGGKPVPQRALMVQYTLLVPADKTFERVKPGERNPFGKSDDTSGMGSKGANEENTIRDLLGKLRASGASFEKEDTRVMLGDMILRPGQFVPAVLPHQTLNLKVASIRSDSIELQWVEKKYSGLPPRILTIPVDLRPVVHYKLQGQGGLVNLAEAAAIAKTMKMGEQFQPGLVGEQPPALAQTSAVPGTVASSTIGAAWQNEDSTTKPASEAPVPSLPARKMARGMTVLAPVNLDVVSRFVPKQPTSTKAAVGSAQSP